MKEFGGGVLILDPSVSCLTFICTDELFEDELFEDELFEYEDLEFVSRG